MRHGRNAAVSGRVILRRSGLWEDLWEEETTFFVTIFTVFFPFLCATLLAKDTIRPYVVAIAYVNVETRYRYSKQIFVEMIE